MRLKSVSNRHCPSCGKKFKKGEPYPDVKNCEVCERYGSPVKEWSDDTYNDLEDADEFGEDESLTFADIAINTGASIELVLRVATDLRDAGELCGVYWDVIEPSHDLDRNDYDLISRVVTENQGRINESYEGLEDNDEFGVDSGYRCDNCNAIIDDGTEFTPDSELTADELELYKTCENLLNKLYPFGHYPEWYCSAQCMRDRIDQLKERDRLTESYDNLEDADEFSDGCSGPNCTDTHDLLSCRCGSMWCYLCFLRYVLFDCPSSKIVYDIDPHGSITGCPDCNCGHGVFEDINESYEGLEDSDEFVEYKCSTEGCDAEYDFLRCTNCGSMWCDTCVTYNRKNFGLEHDFGDIDGCPNCGGPQRSTRLNESYEGLEDNDEFEEDRGYDPVWDEFTYRFLGSRTGHEFTFRGHTYRVGGNFDDDVHEDGVLIAKKNQPVPWEEFQYNGYNENFPPERFTWKELARDLHAMYTSDDHDDPPPGVGIYY